MNTENQNQTDAPIKRGAGRPKNPACVHTLRISRETGKPLGQGRVKEGLLVDEVVVHRFFNSRNFDENTPIISRKTVEFHSIKGAAKAPKPSNVNVVVVNPEETPVEQPQATQIANAVEIPA